MPLLPALQEPNALQQHLAISEALQQAQAAEVGRALLSAELMLEGEGRLSEQWIDVWQLPWRRSVLMVAAKGSSWQLGGLPLACLRLLPGLAAWPGLAWPLGLDWPGLA